MTGSPWEYGPPPRGPKGSDLLVVTLAVIIGLLLLAGGVGAAVKATSQSASPSVAAATTTTNPGPSSLPSSPSTASPSTTSPGGVAPVSPLAVPPVTAPPVSAHQITLAPSVVAAQVNPAVVDIDTRLAYQHAIAAGTGMILTSNGIVLTNNHVIDGATTIGAVSVGSGKTYTAHVLGVDPTADVAIIQLDGASGLATINPGSTLARAGDPVVAIGNAGGLGGAPSVTSGAVVATDESIIANDSAAGTSEQLDGLIETTAALQPGDSGGPLANGSGQVIGMNTAASVSSQSGTGVSFAIPIGQALAIAHQIEAGQASSTVRLGLPPFLGVQVANGTGTGGHSGAVVSSVVAGGPAAAVGVNAGAVIVAISGQVIDSATTLSTVLREFHPGETVTLNWFDNGGVVHSARLTLATGPAD